MRICDLPIGNLTANTFNWHVAAVVISEGGRFVVDDVLLFKDDSTKIESRLPDSIGRYRGWAKAQEMAEMLFAHHSPEMKAIIMERFLEGIKQRIRDFYAEEGQWPFFKRDPDGRGLVMATKEEINQLPVNPPRPVPGDG